MINKKAQMGHIKAKSKELSFSKIRDSGEYFH